MVNTICLQKAVDWTTAWRAQGGTFTDHEDLKGFLIPLADLKEVIAEPGVANIRAYIGVDDTDGHQPHLVIVGVNAEGEDIIYKAAGEGCEDSDGSVNTGLYDFSQPCPTTCDTSSPLYGLKK
ncbi:hypothetical protein EZY14_009745 [Kordia sp. TARA_039_SRF]|jgi:hypothetical protein|nr:hypothetical protein EZY14_009745 [Kordia sp. TARA_039_SRF]